MKGNSINCNTKSILKVEILGNDEYMEICNNCSENTISTY